MDLMQRQLELEIAMADRGIARYMRAAQEAKQNGDATRIQSVQALLDTALGPVSEAFDDFCAAAKAGRGGRRHTAVRFLGDMDGMTVAYVALSSVLDGVGGIMDAAPIALMIGSALEREAAMKLVEDQHPVYVKRLMKDLDGRTRNTAHRRAVLNKVIREKGEAITPWTRADHMTVGLKMIELIIQSTGLFTVGQRREGKKTVASLFPAERLHAFLSQLDTRFGLLSPEYLPTVVPPKAWEGLRNGGYYSDALAYPPTFVKTSDKKHIRELEKADLSRVYRAVNAIQNTAWQINSDVLAVIKALIERGAPTGGLPAMENTPLPALPEDMDTNDEAKTAWKREAVKVYDANRRLVGRRVNTLRALAVAEEFSEFERIYFPHQLDFRGRVYPIPQGLNPQGNDMAKGLLRFADGKPLDTVSAIHWFKIHGANCFGVDKVSFDDRLAWVEENAEHIIRSAEDPLGYQWWADADSPFCFLAWAFEFNEWLQSDIPNATFKSRIAIAMDGSCNGLQHYSAMLRDPRGGAATNLTPSAKPQDIYGEVAGVTTINLQKIALAPIDKALEGDKREEAIKKAAYAAAWGPYGIDRKITKRPVMVLPYGGTLLSCMDYVNEAVGERGGSPFNDEEFHKACAFLGTVVWDSIGEVVVAAKLAMNWLKKVTATVAKENKPIKWVAPSGFPVVQAYPVMDSKQIDCYLLGSRFQPQLRLARPDSIDARRQQNGVAPNFVHSLDASALIDTVNRALDRGVDQFAMIHDSYGTTAHDSAILSEALRDAFVAMYEENNVLEQFADTAVPSYLRAEVPSAPFVGGLDLQEVKKSLYFFA